MGNSQHRLGNTELLNAAQALDVSTVSTVLESGRGISERTLRRALFSAVESNHVELLLALLRAGVDPSCHRHKDGFTPLHIAASNHLPQAAEHLIQFGADPSKCDLLGRTPLWMAARLGAPVLLQTLMQSPKAIAALNKPDKSGWTPLMVSSSRSHGNRQIPQQLMTKGAKLKVTDKDGKYVTHIAAAAGDHVVLSEILQSAPDLAFVRDHRMNTPLHLAAERGQIACCSTLLKTAQARKCINMKNSKQRSALWLSCERGDAQIAALLLRHDANGNLKDKQGWNALRAAVYACSYDTVETLLIAGVDVQSDCTAGISALHSAAFYDSLGQITKLLIDYNAKPNAKDKKGKTPLHVAAETGNATAIRLLLRHGGKPQMSTSRGKTVLQKCRDKSVEKLINDALIGTTNTTSTGSMETSYQGSRSTPPPPPRRPHRPFELRQSSAFGSTGSTGDSSTSDDRASEELSQRIAPARPSSSIMSSSVPESSKFFGSRISSSISGLSFSMRKKSRPTKTGRSMLPAKMTSATGVPSSLQCCSVGSGESSLQLHGCAQLDFDAGTLRCQTLLYAKVLDASQEDMKKLIFNTDINLPSSSQIWSKPISIDIPGSPGQLLQTARLVLHSAGSMPGTDLRVYRHTATRGWEEIEILSSEMQPKQQMCLTVETQYLGIFVVLCCAARTVHSLKNGTVELFGGIGMQIVTENVGRAEVVCEMEPPTEDYTRDMDLEELEQQLPPTPYLPQNPATSVLGHVGDSHPTIFSLRLLEETTTTSTTTIDMAVTFGMTIPDGYCLGTLADNSSTFKRLQTNQFQLNSNTRLQLCVWKIQNMEQFIQVNRFHQMPLRLFVKLIQNCKNYTLKVSVQDDDDAREFFCSEAEKLDISSGGIVEMKNVQVCLNRGLLPLEIPLKMKKVNDNAPGASLNANSVGHIQIRAAKRAITIPISFPPRS